jgi:hypothetical protein
MTAASAAQALERRDQQALAQRRRRAEVRLSYERKRNWRLASAGLVGLAVALVLGLHASLAPAVASEEVAPVDPATLEFAKTRVAHVLITSTESAYCRELRFSNDSGRFSDAGRYRCFIDNEPTLNPGTPPRPTQSGANARSH